MSDEFTSDVSFRELVMEQVGRILVLGSREMRGGFYTFITDNKGNRKETYIADSREELSEAIELLSIVLFPKFDESTTKIYNEHKDALEKLKKDFLDNVSTKWKVILGEVSYKTVEDKILLESFKQQKLSLFKDLLLELNKLMESKNYFVIGGGTF